METVLRRGPTSRAELAKLTGLSRQTTTQVVLELQRDGWLQVNGRIQGPLGRSAPTYELNPTSALVLGIRLEGSILQMALANIRGDVVAEIAKPTDPQGGRNVIHQVGLLFLELIKASGVPRNRILRAVVGTPGVVDPRSGRIDIAPSIPHLGELNVVEAMRQELGVPSSIENGVKLAALGELWQGVAQGLRDFIYFGIGSGVGMGIVSDGKLLRGARGAAGEIAYLPIGGDPFDPISFADGTFETAISSAALVRRYEGYADLSGQTVDDVFLALAKGDLFASAAVDEIARLITIGISAVCATTDPELLVLGGSIGRRDEIAERVRAILPRVQRSRVEIRASILGNRATLVGALGMALNQLHAELFGVDAVSRQISITDLGSRQPE
jgi:predicted NBD/HSP70 family sugar kinase